MFNSVIATTVTYGDRWQYLKQLILRLNEIDNIRLLIIFGNGINYSINAKIDNEFNNLRIGIIVEDSSKNLGSAGGFYQVLKKCSQVMTSDDYVLMLDDDNVPDENIFSNLVTDTAAELPKNKKYVFAFFRARYDTELFENKKVYDRSRYFNSYCKFTVLNKFDKNRKSYANPYTNFSEVPYSQYSGLLFSADVLDKVGLPNENYYLYVDDTDFSYRITLAGYHIMVYSNGQITDLENSWSQETQTEEIDPHKSIFFTKKIDRGLYYIRNRVNFECTFLTKNKIIYNLNIFIYYCGVFVLFMPKNKYGLNIFFKMLHAVRDGKRGKLGEFLIE